VFQTASVEHIGLTAGQLPTIKLQYRNASGRRRCGLLPDYCDHLFGFQPTAVPVMHGVVTADKCVRGCVC